MLELNGCTVLESCHVKQSEESSVYLTDHYLVFVLSGRLATSVDGDEYSITANEAVFARKGQNLNYRKIGLAEGQPYESLIFAFSNEMIREFLQMRSQPKQPSKPLSLPFFKIAPNEELNAYIQTMQAYLRGNLLFEPELVRLKILEMLFVLTAAAPEVNGYLAQFSYPEKLDFVKLMEKHFTQRATLAEFAQLTGRSLSSFKRDFQAVFHTSPARWLQERRLQLARQFLLSTDKSVTDVCYEVGFENLSHFSRNFKEFYGQSPSSIRKRTAWQKTMS